MVSRGKFIADDANLEDFDVDIFERSCYFRHIAFLFKIFPREQVLIEYYDTILDNPEKLLEKIYGFLEIKSNNFPDNINRWYGKGFNPKYIFLDRIRQVSHDYLQKKQMYKLIIWIKKMRLPNFYKWLVPKRKGVNKNHINLLKSQKQRLYSDLINLNSADIDFDKHAIKKWLSVDSNKV